MLLASAALALALVATQKPKPQKPPRPAPVPVAMRILCTPNALSIDGGPPQDSKNPIAAALTVAAPGARIELAPGDYHGIGIGFDKDAYWNARTKGGTRASPIIVDGLGRARIVGDDKGDAITVSQQIRNGFITFQNLDIRPGGRAGVLFSQGNDWVHEGYRFLDVSILGEWDHLTDTGPRNSKWGVYGRGLKDFEFRGVKGRPRISDLRREHAFYLQNLRGNVLIENIDVARVGRTFLQLTAREREGPPGVGTLTIRNCSAEDCCIAAGDSNKGGSAFTFAGRHTGTILLQNNRYRAGFVPALRKLTRPEAPYGTGALVAWDGNDDVTTARLVLENNDFEMAAGCGDRSLVMIGACQTVELRGANRFVAGANPAALDLEPVREARPQGSPVGSLFVDPTTVVKGKVRWRGEKLSLEELKAKYAASKIPPGDRRERRR
jgi:hypothetical protein